MIDFIIQNWWKILLGIIGLVVLIISIVYRRELKKKIKQETISFTALVISLSLAVVGFATKQQTEVTTLAFIGEQRVSLYFSIFWIFVIIFVVALIIFFRRELLKEW